MAAPARTYEEVADFASEINAPDEAIEEEDREEERSPERQYALVELGGYTLAVDVTCTTQVIERPVITPVPNTAEFVLGVCNVRGDIYSVVDIRSLLGLDPVDQDKRLDPLVLVLRGNQYTCGVSIEAISALLWVRDADIAVPTNEIPFISGLHRRDQMTVLVLDVEALLESPEMTQYR